MYAIIQTKEKSLMDYLKSIDLDQFKYKYGELYERADNYYFDGKVKEINVVNDNHIEAIVSGRRKYDVDILYEKGNISSNCSCSFGGVCKHAIATLIYTLFEEWHFEEIKTSSEFDLKNYLRSLNKDELIQLIIDQKSTDLIQKLQNKTLSQNELKAKVMKANKELEKLFKELDWETDIHWMDEKLETIFKIFNGGWHLIVDEITELLIQTITRINEAIEEGQLYDHYSDETFSGELFSSTVKSFIREIPTKDKFDVLEKLEVLQSEYLTIWNSNTIASELLNSTDEKYLKKYLLEQKISKEYITIAYNNIKGGLNEDEKEILLKKYGQINQDLLLEYAELLERKFLLKEAECLFQDYFEWTAITEIKEALLKKWISIKHKLNVSIEDNVNILLKVFSSKENLHFAITLLPDYQIKYENIVREKNFTDYILFLEKENRMIEAEDLVCNDSTLWNEDFKFQFYCRNGKQFKQKSTEYLNKRIDKNLQTTGDSYYYTIAHTLKELSKFNPEKTIELLKEIRINYKRRSNLMQILREL